MSNVVSLQGRDPNKRLVWMERDPAEGYVVRTNYGEGLNAASTAKAAADDLSATRSRLLDRAVADGPQSRHAAVVAVLFAAFLVHRDRARVAPGREYGDLIRLIYQEEFGAGEGAA